MKYRIVGTSGGNMHSGEMLTNLGLKPGNHLPDEGMPERTIQGIQVYVKAKIPTVGYRRVKHRVIAVCPGCGSHVSAGRLHQHRCRLDKKQLFVSLDNAVNNGYELLDWKPEKIAEDIHEYDQQFENVSPKLLIPAITEWCNKELSEREIDTPSSDF